MLHYTFWPSLYDVSTHENRSQTWEDFCAKVLQHTTITHKNQAPGFGPYALQTATELYKPCRQDDDVETMSMFVYDADEGEITTTLARLAGENIVHAAYTSFSHSPAKPSWRVIIPLEKAFDARSPQRLLERLLIKEKYAIPANLNKCSGKSHFYFLPSCPPGATPQVVVGGSKYYAPETDLFATVLEERPPPLNFKYEPPPETQGVVDLREYRRRVQDRINKIAFRHKDKADLLRRVLRGAPLAPEGDRHAATLQVTGMLAWLFPRASLGVLSALLAPSINAMVAEGSVNTPHHVENMLLRAMENRARQDAKDQQLREWFNR